MRKLLLLLFPLFLNIAHAEPLKEWTILSFQNGNNNLDSLDKKAIMRMEKVGSSDQVNVVVQWASASRNDTVRMLIKKSEKGDTVHSPVLQDLGKIDMGDYKQLEAFIKWGVENFPAKHYFISVSDHGAGWREFERDNAKVIMGDISNDELSKHAISTEELGLAMKYAAQLIGHKVDIYGSDACYMAMPEVANEMWNYVDYFVGSEESEPGWGWPYKSFLTQMVASPGMSPRDVSVLLVKLYGEFYNNQKYTTFSAWDLNQLGYINRAAWVLRNHIILLDIPTTKELVKHAKKTQMFANEYGDLLDFANNSRDIFNSDDLNVLNDAYTRLVIANYASTFYKGRAHGLSVWLPVNLVMSEYDKVSYRYRNLEFSKNSIWYNAVAALMDARR